MKTLQLLKLILINILFFASVVYANNPRQTVEKELLSKTTSNGNTILEWVVRYQNNSQTPLGNVIITDNFNAPQTYVNNTEQHPNGWSVTQSPNQFIWQKGNSNQYTNSFPTNTGEIIVQGSGDGYAPIPYTSLTGQKRIYFLNHHLIPNNKLFNCVGSCIGIWPRVLPDGDVTSTLTTGTTNGPETVIINKYLYYAVTRVNDSGVGCFDLELNTECGYLGLSSTGAGNSTAKKMEGPFKVGNNLILIDSNMITYKVSITGINVMTNVGSFDLTTTGFTTQSNINIGGEVVNNNIYFVQSPINSVACINSINMTPCPSWSTSKTLANSSGYGPGSFIYYDTSMNPTDICVRNGTTQTCLSLSTGVDTSVGKADIFNSDIVGGTGYGSGGEFVLGTKTFIPPVFKNTIYCHDWSTATSCNPSIISKTIGGNPRNYATQIDKDGCAWVYGDSSILWSFDPLTGVTPCGSNQEMIIEDTYDASNNWCASKDPDFSYSTFKIDSLNPNDFTNLKIEYFDINGNIIKTVNLTGLSNYNENLSLVPFIQGDPIHYKITGIRNPQANNTNSSPLISIDIDGPPREFCFKTQIPCPITGDITNHVEVKIQGSNIIDSSDEVIESGEEICIASEPSITKCLELTPKLTCSKTGWVLEVNTLSPNTFSSQELDLSVKAPSNATITKWGTKWHLNGVTSGDTITLVTNATKKGAGSAEGTDLCCLGEKKITIPDEECIVEAPHVYARKEYKDGKFELSARVMSEIHAPQVLTLTDTLPPGITITSIDPESTSEWSCSNTFPITGPTSVNCVYIGAMPILGIKTLSLHAQIDNNQMPAENCVDSGVFSTDGTTFITNPMMHQCLTIPKEEENKKENIQNVSPVLISKPANLSIKKYAPKECKAGGKCTFTFKITNNGSAHNGPISISDVSKPFIGQYLYDNSKQWKCVQTRTGYKCTNPKVSLKPKESFRLKLTTRVPKNAKGYLKNCAKISSPKSSNKYSCVTVKIRKKESTKPINITKPTCPSWQHWNGKRCISCPVDTTWNKKYQECLSNKKDIQVNIPITKPKIVKKEVEKVECGFLQKYNKDTKKCETIIDINFGVGFGKSGGSLEDK